jgi:enoyl-CoA hydratase/carnithine racemase
MIFFDRTGGMFSTKQKNRDGLRLTEVSFTSESSGNALGAAEAKAFAQLLRNFDADGLLVKSEGRRFFCTGGNLKEQTRSSRAMGLATQRSLRKSLSAIASLAVPTVAVVSGDAFGGGVELLSAFDHVIALPHAQLGIWQRKLGLTFGWGGGTRLLARLGRARLFGGFLEARVYSAFEAERMGLVDEVLPAFLAEERAWQWLARAAALPSSSLKSLRRWTPASEARLFERLWFGPDHLRTLKRF